jgi:hypothetical protein
LNQAADALLNEPVAHRQPLVSLSGSIACFIDMAG